MKHYLTVMACFFYLTVMGQAEDASRRRNFNTVNDIAIKEFDPVSYFKGKPTRGIENFAHTFKGITYYFANQANLDEFKKSPAKYEPAYGGWCAYTMALTGERAKMDPTNYKMINNKVYLFANFNGNNTLLKWNKDEKKLREAADKNWIKKMH